jgi:hypothetical protein
MAEIEITSTSLVVQIEGFDRFPASISGLSGGVKARLEVPLEHVAGVDASVPEAHQIWKGWTVFALSLPRSVTVGRLIHLFGDRRGEWTFWDVTDPDKACSRMRSSPPRSHHGPEMEPDLEWSGWGGQ